MKAVFESVFGVCLCLLLGGLAQAEDAVPPVCLKVGIEVQAETAPLRLAKSFDRLKAGDRLRIHVIPADEPIYVYVVQVDEQAVRLLYPQAQTPVASATALILPSAETFYKVDGKSALEQLTIIGSRQVLPELDALKSASCEEWDQYEVRLMEGKDALLTNPVPKPNPFGGRVACQQERLPELKAVKWREYAEQFTTLIAAQVADPAARPAALGGTVRGVLLNAEWPMLSGSPLVVKKYEFRVQRP